MKNSYQIINKIKFTYIALFFALPSTVIAQAFTDVVVDSVTVLPIKLKSFSANRVEKNVQLNWSVESQKSVSYFVVHKSFDGVIFEGLANVKASTTTNYNFLDNNVLDKNLFYRLESVDVEGKATFSNIVMLPYLSTTTFNVNVYPNPIINHTLNLAVKNSQPSKYNVDIKSIDGAVVFSKVVTISSANTSISIDLPITIIKGVYILSFYNKEGLIENKKLIIN